MIFDVEKSEFGTFWHLPITPIRKIQMISFDCSWFLAKNFFNFFSPTLKTPQPVLT